VVVKFIVVEFVEASKRPQKKANEGGGFDRLNHRIFKGILWSLSLSKRPPQRGFYLKKHLKIIICCKKIRVDEN